jgi:GTP-binding protein
LEFVHWLGSKAVSIVLVFTKTDKSKPGRVQKNIALFKESILESFEELPEIFTCSAVTKDGLPELLELIDAALAGGEKIQEKSRQPAPRIKLTPW